jgi:predicted transcriptional regulator of viral defense system
MDTLTNPDQIEIYDFLKRFPNLFISVTEVSKNVGNRKRFHLDRNWARPILRRLEMEGWLESNAFGEYRLKRRPEDNTTFKEAIKVAGMDLGETAIIMAEEKETLPDAPETAHILKNP